ncbi:MAG: hypothetical protein ACAH59_07560 [Pseudobdellovibrionaceae bacterium]
MSKFEIKIEKAGSAWKVNMAGVIDEDADFNPHSLAGAPAVELQLSQIKSINSCGIREWIKWMGTAGSVPVKYHECPKIIVDQINMVQGFLPANGKVMSFYVPYYNDDSGSEKNVLFTLGKEYGDQGIQAAPAVKDEQGNDMEMDIVEAKYFKFLKK